MATRFDFKGGFADQAAHRRQRHQKTPEKIDALIDWRPIEALLDKELDRRPDAVGNPAYPALGMFKALLLQSWYDLSDRELSENLEDRISFSHFCGFSLDHEVPDNSTICRFRNHLHAKGLAQPLLDMINAQIEAGGLEIKAGIIVDASLVESSRRPRKRQDVIESTKKDHRMARARYLGTAKVGLQLLLDAMAFNLKKAIRMAWA